MLDARFLGSRRGTLHQWRLEAELACTGAGTRLTEVGWDAYFVDVPFTPPCG